jgi:hypothetical protein
VANWPLVNRLLVGWGLKQRAVLERPFAGWRAAEATAA